MNLDKAISFIWENARHLERAIFAHHFYGAPSDRIIAILRTYQNEDGGFGNALEPDVRAPDSQPLFVEYGLNVLYASGLRNTEIAGRLCDFLASHADLQKGIASLLPSARKFPHASHWGNPSAVQPSIDRLIGLVGLLQWQGIDHAWLKEAVRVCLERALTTPFDDAHTLGTAFCLAESTGKPLGERLFDKLAAELPQVKFFSFEAPVKGYALTPLQFAPTPTSPCRRLFSTDIIEAHLDDLESRQEADGGWPISWEPPGQMARMEWRGVATVQALITLRAYGRV